VSKYLTGTDPNNLGKDSGFTEITPFDSNIGKMVKGYATKFQSGDVQLNIVNKIVESIPQNVGKTATLKYPAAPPTDKWDNGARTPLTPAEAEKAKKEWAAGLRRIMHVYGLTEPTDEQLENDIAATGWLNQGEGAEVVFNAYNKDGYGVVSAIVTSFVKNDREYVAHVAVSKVSDPARDSKGIIPGLTRGEQAREKIAKVKAKA